jgi:tetratricopeptide (TPR) repeat protein
MVAVQQSLGQLQLVQGKWEEATKGFLDTLRVSRELGAKEFEAVALGYLGRSAQYQGRYAAAFDNWRQALERVRELGDARGEVEFSLFEAEALGELGMLAEAEQAVAAVETKLAQAGNDEQRAMLASLRGAWALRRGERANAATAFDSALERATASRSVSAALRARLGRARAASGNAGRQALRAVEREAQERGDAWVRLGVAEALAEAELARGDPAAAEAEAVAALRLARECGGYSGAYRLELLRARSLAARGDEAGAGAARRAAAAEVERLRAGLDPRQVGSLDQLAEVRELARHTLAPAR